MSFEKIIFYHFRDNSKILVDSKFKAIFNSFLFFKKNPLNMIGVGFIEKSNIGKLFFYSKVVDYILSEEGFDFIYIAVPGPFQKIILKSKDFIYKIPNTADACKLIVNEYSILEKIKNVFKQYIPKVDTFYVLDNVPVVKFYNIHSKLIYRVKFEPFVFLYKKERAFLNQKKIRQSNIYCNIIENFESIKDYIGNKTKYTLEKAILFLENYKEKSIYTTLAHRDFTKWNLLKNHEGIKVIDWEYAKFDYNILYDYVHYILFPYVLKQKSIALSEIQKRLLNIRHNLVFNIFKKNKDVKLDVKLEFLLYMLDLALFYLNSQKGKNENSSVIIKYLEYINFLIGAI